jgi:hypothetical protein
MLKQIFKKLLGAFKSKAPSPETELLDDLLNDSEMLRIIAFRLNLSQEQLKEEIEKIRGNILFNIPAYVKIIKAYAQAINQISK